MTRGCGGCSGCCHVVAVKEIGLPSFTRCPHLTTVLDAKGPGCGIYADRPYSCRSCRATPRPRNEAATRIYRANWMRANPDDHPEDLPDIAGTAVLFDRIVWR